MGTMWNFVGIDLAPNESLETGVAVLNRERRLVRMDKIYTDDDILLYLDNLAPDNNLVVALDMPKSLSIPGRWRQEEIKMHPLRLIREEDNQPQGATGSIDRYAQRATDLFNVLTDKGVIVFLYFNYQARMRYDLNIPYRNRTPQGCRALQSLIKLRLSIPNVPSNLAPSSVLDAMIGAYTAWSMYKGKLGQHFHLFKDSESRLILDPLKRVHG